MAKQAASSLPPRREHGFEDELEDDLMEEEGAESGWVEARTSCDHLDSLSSDLSHIPTPDTLCNSTVVLP
ncbi:hypothetical protein HS088_TW17G00739 [Tripterygium wilfordii]|uniref:Uncharacterized protein n=1 Tax=Tripterygium wilfordii TaxID=458696 RepID=A0A7J7CGN9_TRIWF|nr:hypothetical protein HS088_TW17G00739 [Tripterygium wilfordii]